MNTEPSQAPQVSQQATRLQSVSLPTPLSLQQARWASPWEAQLRDRQPAGGALRVDTALSQSMVPKAEAVSKLIKQMFSGSLGEPFLRRMASLEGIAVLIQPQWDGGGRGIWSRVEPLNTHHPFVRSVVQSCDQHIFSMLLSACGASGQNLK